MPKSHRPHRGEIHSRPIRPPGLSIRSGIRVAGTSGFASPRQHDVRPSLQHRPYPQVKSMSPKQQQWHPVRPSIQQSSPRPHIYSPRSSCSPTSRPTSQNSSLERGLEASGGLGEGGNSNEPTSHTTYWCQRPGQSVQEVFHDSCILQLVERDDGAPPKPSTGGGYAVTIPGLCPFHVIAEKKANGTTICGGVQSHVHEKATGESTDKVVTKESLVLKIPLVTQPISLNVLLKIPDLRRLALYFYREDILPKLSQTTSGVLTEPLAMHTVENTSSFKVNPACRRMLQWMAEEKMWKLDESSQFSIDSWTNVIGHENMLFFSRGMRVPYPHNQKFRASSNIYRIAIGFWSPFQQKMWKSFLDSNIEECFLDAAFRCDRDGFQLWTLLYERDGQIIPISYLLTTATTVKLVADWLSALIDQSPETLPKKVIYINTLKAMMALEHVFPGWDICFNKYYIDQELKSLVLRRNRKDFYDPRVISAIQNIDVNFTDAVKAVKNTPDLENEVDYIFSQANIWNPKSYKELERFSKSSGVVCRWRYLLWMTLLSRPLERRIDPMVYFLVSILTPGVEQAVKAQKNSSQDNSNFSMDSLEQGGKSPEPGFEGMRLKFLDESLVCLIPKNTVGTCVVDKKFNVCYCSKFIQKKHV